jgi:hypothetical protein
MHDAATFAECETITGIRCYRQTRRRFPSRSHRLLWIADRPACHARRACHRSGQGPKKTGGITKMPPA